jgi:hypothetical protein
MLAGVGTCLVASAKAPGTTLGANPNALVLYAPRGATGRVKIDSLHQPWKRE